MQQLKADEKISNALRENLDPYTMEAGLQPELLCGGRDVLIQGLLWYFVIDKRKRELDDIAEGNCNTIPNDITIILIIVTVTFIIITISCYFYCIIHVIIMTVAMFSVVVHLFYFLIIDGFDWL